MSIFWTDSTKKIGKSPKKNGHVFVYILNVPSTFIHIVLFIIVLYNIIYYINIVLFTIWVSDVGGWKKSRIVLTVENSWDFQPIWKNFFNVAKRWSYIRWSVIFYWSKWPFAVTPVIVDVYILYEIRVTSVCWHVQ